MSYEPIDNDEDAVEFDVAKIEQMEVEFETCPICQGCGMVFNGLIYYNCPKCYGTGEITRKETNVKN